MSRPAVLDPLKHFTETESFQRALTVSLVVAVGALTGVMVLNAVPAFTGSGADVSIEGVRHGSRLGAWLSVARRSFEPKTLALLLLVAGLGVGIAARGSAIKINTFAVGNGLLYAAAVSLILPVIPVTVMVALAIGAALFYRPRSRERWSGFFLVLALCVAVGVVSPVLAPLMGDQVRSQIPLRPQLLGAIPSLVAFGVVFCVKRLRWGLRQFESFYMVVIVGSMILCLEALTTFYIGWPSLFPGLAPPVLPAGQMFQSSFVQNHHVVARLGLTTIFMSLYFYTRRSQTRYLFSTLAGLLLMVATGNRMPAMATGLGLTVYFLIGSRWTEITRRGVSIRRMGAVMVAVMVLGSSVPLVSGITERRVAIPLASSGSSRLLHWARAVDVLAYAPILGTGPGIDTYYSGSGRVPPVLLLAAAERLGMSDTRAIGLIATNQLYSFQEEKGHSAHNLWLQVVMNWGLLLGGLGILYFVYGAFRAAHTLSLARPSVDTRAAWLALAFAVSLSVSVIGTSKFSQFWFFAITCYFVAANLRRVKAKGEGGRSEARAA